MKKIITSATLALGAVSLQAAYAPDLSPMETSKPWSLSASLRGFYDDNYTTSPKGIPGGPPSSYGFELSPSASVNLPMEQTFVGLSYIYSMRYYDDRSNNRADHTHQFNAKLDHAFSEKYKIELSDSFVIAQEPTVIDPSLSLPLRTDGNNMRNTGILSFTAQITQLLGIELGYRNTFYDYEQSGPGSRSALLDRMEHLASLDLRYQVMPQTVGVLGFQYGIIDYNSDDPIIAAGFDPITGLPTAAVPSSIRDNRSYYLFVGADHNFNSQLNGSIRVGGQYTDYHRADHDAWSPYADANVTYSYAPGSYLQGGARHQRNQTDFAGNLNDITFDQESTSFYVSVSHKITPRLTGSLLGQYQHSEFEGGAADNLSDDFFIVGLNLAYRFNAHLLAEGGYNYDRLNSDLPLRGYRRNRGYIGIRATF